MLPKLVRTFANLANRYGVVATRGPRVGDPARLEQAGGQHPSHFWIDHFAAEVIQPAGHECLKRNLLVVHSGVQSADPLVVHHAASAAELGFRRSETWVQLQGRRPSHAFLFIQHASLSPENQEIAAAHFPRLDRLEWFSDVVVIRQPLTRASPVHWVQRELLRQVRLFRDQPPREPVPENISGQLI